MCYMKKRVYSTIRLPYESVMGISEMVRMIVVKNPEGFMDPIEVKGFESVDGTYYSKEKIARKIISVLVSEGSIEDVDWNYRYDCALLGHDEFGGEAELELYVTMDVLEECRS